MGSPAGGEAAAAAASDRAERWTMSFLLSSEARDLAARAVEVAVDAALGEVARQAGRHEPALREARGVGLGAASIFLDALAGERAARIVASTALREAYEADLVEREVRYPPVEGHRCRYCGRYWHRFAWSRFDGHAVCRTSPEFRKRVVAILDGDGAISYGQMGEVLGVSKATVRTWWDQAKGNPLP